MNIHTTQNLISKVRKQSTDNVTIPEIRSNYSEQMRKQNLYDQPDSFEGGVSFKGKKGPTVENAKKIFKVSKKVVGDIPKTSQPKMKKGDSLNDSPLLNKILNFANNEILATATIAAVACMLRAATIGALPAKDENTKINNKYAMGHTLASGTVGFITAFALTAPFKGGADYVRKNLWKNMSEKTLKRFHPQLDLKSISANGKRLDIDMWKNLDGRQFCQEIKNCSYLPEFKQIGDVSEQTFKNILKVDADWASQKGKSFNDVVLKDGSKLYDKIDMSRLGLVVKEGEFDNAQILFKDMDKSYFADLIKDSKDSNLGKLDIKSVYNEKGEVVDFRKWKDVDGKQWKLDLDETFVASPYETFADYRPRISGAKRFDPKEKVYKFRTYQKNGENDKLGTMITDKMHEQDENNNVLFKFLTYFPDLAFRVPIAMTTVALIPWILKNCLGLEKKKVAEQKPELQKATVQNDNKNIENKESENVSFKGGKKEPNWFIKKLGEYYGKPLMEQEWLAKLTNNINRLPGRATQHMTVLGSFITSGMYVQQTLNKKELDPDKRRTLAVNQTLGFIIPTLAAYFANAKLDGWIKRREYSFTGRQQHNIDIAKLEGNLAKAKEIEKSLGVKKNGVRILADLVTFTLIYRYVVPVAITPIANKIGDKINARKAEKRRLAQEQQNQKTTEIKIPVQKELKQAV